jgi:uncharacterized damage-inducible protein DinB
MTIEEPFAELNRAATQRIRALAARLTDAELQRPVGKQWTIAATLAHLAFWDRRALMILDKTESAGKLVTFEIDIVVNDVALPLWAAIPPREAARLAIESAEALDKRLENFPPALLEAVYSQYKRGVVRALHRNEHLDEAEAALKG